jgi:hypothetical protein
MASTLALIQRAHHRAKVLVSRHRDGEINALAWVARHRGHSRPGNHGGGFRKGGVSSFKEMLSALEAGWQRRAHCRHSKVARVADRHRQAASASAGHLSDCGTRGGLNSTTDRTAINLHSAVAAASRELIWVPPTPTPWRSKRRGARSSLNAATARAYALADRRGAAGRTWPRGCRYVARRLLTGGCDDGLAPALMSHRLKAEKGCPRPTNATAKRPPARPARGMAARR